MNKTDRERQRQRERESKEEDRTETQPRRVSSLLSKSRNKWMTFLAAIKTKKNSREKKRSWRKKQRVLKRKSQFLAVALVVDARRRREGRGNREREACGESEDSKKTDDSFLSLLLLRLVEMSCRQKLRNRDWTEAKAREAVRRERKREENHRIESREKRALDGEGVGSGVTTLMKTHTPTGERKRRRQQQQRGSAGQAEKKE